MRRPRLIIGLFLLATVVVDAALVLFEQFVGQSDISNTIFAGFHSSQIGLVAIWLGLGKTTGPLRLLAACFLLVGLAWIFIAQCFDAESCYDSDLSIFSQMVAIIVTGGMAAAVPLFVARLLGVRIVYLSCGDATKLVPAGMEHFQFSIRWLFGLTTALAIILSTLKCLGIFDPRIWAIVSDNWAPTVGGACIASAAVWATFGNRWKLLRAIALIAALAADFAMLTIAFSDADKLSCMLSILLEAPLLVGSLWVFRLAGYRVVFRRAAAAESQDGGGEMAMAGESEGAGK